MAISRFGDYEDRSYIVRAQVENNGTYKLLAQPLDQGPPLSTKALRAPAFTKTLKALHVPESQSPSFANVWKGTYCTRLAEDLPGWSSANRT